MNSLNRADVEINKKTGEFKVTHSWDEAQVIKECMEMRNDGTTGMIHGGKARRLARIPRMYFYTDPYLKNYMAARGKDENEARKSLDSFLWRHPEFRTSNPRGKAAMQ